VRDYTSVAKRIARPMAGALSFDIEIVGAPYEPGQRLVVYTVEPGSPTAAGAGTESRLSHLSRVPVPMQCQACAPSGR